MGECSNPGFYCPLWVLGEYGGCGLPGRECFWVPARCGHRESQVECISRYWELTWRNGNRLKGSARGRKAGSAARFDGVSREWNQRGRTGPCRVCCRAEDETGEWELKDRKESEDCLPDSQWSVCSPVESASRHWWLTQRDGVREEGWVQRFSRVPGEWRQTCEWSARVIGMRPWNWNWKSGRSGTHL